MPILQVSEEPPGPGLAQRAVHGGPPWPRSRFPCLVFSIHFLPLPSLRTPLKLKNPILSLFSFLPVSLGINVPNEVNRTLSLVNMPKDAGILMGSTEEAGVSSDPGAQERAQSSSGEHVQRAAWGQGGAGTERRSQASDQKRLAFLCFKISLCV